VETKEPESHSILPRSEEMVFIKAIQDIISLERELEQFKVSLAKCNDFNLIDAFGIIDKDGRGYVTASELHEVLTDFNLVVALDDCRLLFQRYNREQDGALKYSEFTDAFFPFDHKHARLLGTK
jgi:Ca2+-binding EF-hand superfamily protein